MNPAVPPEPRSRRRLAWWVGFGLMLLLTPLVVLGVGVLSMLRLDRNAAALKREVMAASESQWHTKVQMSVGWVTLSAVRAGLHFVQPEHRDDVRLALQAVRRASVGVYERKSARGELSVAQLFSQADRTMQRRGWTRLVGVAEDNKTVLVYASDDLDSGNRVDLCVAVIDGREMVVVSTTVDSSALGDLAALKGGWGGKLKSAKLAF